jgi:plastocyanin
MRRPLLSLIAAGALLALVSACGSSSKTSTSATTAASTAGAGAVPVQVKNFTFHPDPVTIQKGQTIQWTFEDAVAHNVTGSDFHSADLTSGTYSHTFTTAGTFRYQCTIHAGMTGTVIVQ